MRDWLEVVRHIEFVQGDPITVLVGGPLDGDTEYVPELRDFLLAVERDDLCASMIGDPDVIDTRPLTVHRYQLGRKRLRVECGRHRMRGSRRGSRARIPARSAEGRRPENPEKIVGNSCVVSTVGYYYWAGPPVQTSLLGES